LLRSSGLQHGHGLGLVEAREVPEVGVLPVRIARDLVARGRRVEDRDRAGRGASPGALRRTPTSRPASPPPERSLRPTTEPPARSCVLLLVVRASVRILRRARARIAVLS